MGIDSFAVVISDPAAGVTLSPVQHMDSLLELIVLRPGWPRGVWLGEHHRSELWISPQ